MTIKQHGGIFGRNPTFNDVTVDGSLSVAGGTNITGNANVTGDATITGTATAKYLDVFSGVLSEEYQARIGFSDQFHWTLGRENAVTGDFYIKSVSAGTPTEIARFASTGLKFPNGLGIDFSATSGTGTSELFDDYEEGTWTPSLIGATSGSMSFAVTALNRYTKVGRVVHAVAFLSSGDMGAHTISGNVLVSGLPFTATAVGAGVVSVTYCNLTTADEADLTISGYANGTNIHLLKGSSISAVTNADLVASGTNGAIMLDITYETGA